MENKKMTKTEVKNYILEMALSQPQFLGITKAEHISEYCGIGIKDINKFVRVINKKFGVKEFDLSEVTDTKILKEFTNSVKEFVKECLAPKTTEETKVAKTEVKAPATQKQFKSALDEVLAQHKLSDVQLNTQDGKGLVLWVSYEKEGYVRKIWRKIQFNSQKELIDIMKKLTALLEIKTPQQIPQGA